MHKLSDPVNKSLDRQFTYDVSINLHNQTKNKRILHYKNAKLSCAAGASEAGLVPIYFYAIF